MFDTDKNEDNIKYNDNMPGQGANDSIESRIEQLLASVRLLQEKNPITNPRDSNGQVELLIRLFELLMLQKGKNPIPNAKVTPLIEQLESIMQGENPITNDQVTPLIEQLESIIKEQNSSTDDQVKPLMEQLESEPQNIMSKEEQKQTITDLSSNSQITPKIDQCEPKPLNKIITINLQTIGKINEYLKQPWISTDRKKIANELKDGIKKLPSSDHSLKDLADLLFNAQTKILEQDKKRFFVKKQYSRLHQVIGNIIEDINFRYKLERQLNELQTNPRIEEARKKVERIENEPLRFPEAQIQRDLKNSSKLTRGIFKLVYMKSNANLPKKMEEMDVKDRSTLPVLNSTR